MKIERITVCNIASLAGTHSVDFTQKPLRNAGLFSISGATGSGKSTLLDALCLALFDQTPRLQGAKTSKAALNDGEKQNDTRMLLRRHTASGFAEVAFVGVDRQTWTARWSVRRSRNSVHGNLQNVEMVLFHGHISPGGEGRVAEGGRKTQVKAAIVEKVGLTFEQFTRAVLLAQNDFATFLQSTDQERAAILQALTGTEHFEAISRAVYARHAAENQAVKTLEDRLSGQHPLSQEERTQAEAAVLTAMAHVEAAEKRLKQQEACADWFRSHRQKSSDLQAANTAVSAAVQQHDAASERRSELKLTEEVVHGARGLRTAAQQAAEQLKATTAALEKATQQTRQFTEARNVARQNRAAAIATQQQAVRDFDTAQPLLKQARDLDARLQPLQNRVHKATTDLATARQGLDDANSTLQKTTDQQQSLLEKQQSLQDERSQLAQFAPFVKDIAAWLNRLDTAGTAAQQAHDAQVELSMLAEEQRQQQQVLQQYQAEIIALQQKHDAADSALQRAIADEKSFDDDALAEQRSQCDRAYNLLTELKQQLVQDQQLRADAALMATDIADRQTALTTHQSDLQRLQNEELPKAIASVEIARQQLEFMTAAVDDHAQRLRLSLQPDHPCPVCGAEEHPYRNHAPDHDATALKAGKQHLRHLETARDDLSSKQQRLQLAIQSDTDHLAKLQQRRAILQQTLDNQQWPSIDHPEVAAVLSCEVSERFDAVQQRLSSVQEQRDRISKEEASRRAATKLVQTSRIHTETALATLEKQRQQLTKLEKQAEVTQSKLAAAKASLSRTIQQQHQANDALGGLFSGIPNSKEQFTDHPDQFRRAFEDSTGNCARIDDELAAVVSQIQQCRAALGPLKAAAGKAQEAHTRAATDYQNAVAEHRDHEHQRQQLFSGTATDIVEKQLQEKRTAANNAVEQCTEATHQAETSLAAAEESLKSAVSARQANERALQQAENSVTQWLADFENRTQQRCTREQLDQRLARNADWINAERTALQQLEEHVTTATSAMAVLKQQLDEHVQKRPTTDDEPVVQERLQQLQSELKQARESGDRARDVIRDDDQQRQKNAELTQQLASAHAAAEPWRKLDSLIGSADGAKFRMIAQRRTLDLLLHYANQQLNQLSARYRLERAAKSLNLSVIDCDMGEDRRSIHSLSGGESFLVSLALALGLASLTSNRLPIESLFIDEGFGSLDPETLTTAMHALTHLEAQGRRVGVISHVTEMTDAIPVQVKVEKRPSGGASRIVIPGADPACVRPDTAFEANPRSRIPSADIKALARQVLEILQRERQTGHKKVSMAALRKETGCQPKELRSVQTQLAEQVVVDGRSLRLVQAEAPTTHDRQ